MLGEEGQGRPGWVLTRSEGVGAPSLYSMENTGQENRIELRTEQSETELSETGHWGIG